MADVQRSGSEGSRHARERLNGVRDALLRLHKALLESERAGYERVNGRIATRQEFLQLALQHEWFAWLRPVSELIVQIDELLEGDEPLTDERASALVERTRTLLTDGQAPFGRRYHELLQRDPTVLVAHGVVIGRLATVH
jgi:hypothetical protein